MIDVKVKRLTDTAKLPTYGSEKAACFDLYADADAEIAPGGTIMIPTGLSMQPMSYATNGGYVGLIYARSGMASKKGLRPANCVGVVDEDYRGNIIVALHNDSDEVQIVERGDRIAQMMWMPFEQSKLIEVDELDDTERGEGGFGHTGTK